jgi:hypothetical protein
LAEGGSCERLVAGLGRTEQSLPLIEGGDGDALGGAELGDGQVGIAEALESLDAPLPGGYRITARSGDGQSGVRSGQPVRSSELPRMDRTTPEDSSPVNGAIHWRTLFRLPLLRWLRE